MIAADQPTIFDPAQVRVWLTSRDDGNVKYEQGPDAAQNIARFSTANGIELTKLAVMYVNDEQQWDAIYEVTAKDGGAGARHPDTRIHADALITATPGLAMLLPIADCCPVVVYDPVHAVVALVHLGWQSSAANLARKVIEHMQRHYQSAPADLLVWMGPCIQRGSYIFASRPQQAGLPDWQDFVKHKPDGWHIDIAGFNHTQLLQTGISPKHIQTSSVDTATSPDYFSHFSAGQQQRAAVEGRFAVICALSEQV